MHKIDSDVERAFAVKFEYVPTRLKKLTEMLDLIQEFVQYLGSNQYYSDSLNKQVFLLNLDADALMLKLEALSLNEHHFQSAMKLALFKKKQPAFGKREFDEYKKDLLALETEVMELHKRALMLTDEIRGEYRNKC
ncbi:hypothetical protein COT29_02325 [Candidatus Micrarchaeota archaeon CG08_land_8_20_14_0_20_59_11]|nr:MAG: hypothetical protein COT29_02325 [Candidatus Micrarchaeota archaeon CG08_land_8_20_14_0_20_59_11]